MSTGSQYTRRETLHRRPRTPRSRGISLVEMLVAVAVGAIVVLGLADILANTSATYTREEEFARLQENGRIASLIAARHMRPARSTDCKSIGLHQHQGSLTVKACDLLESGCELGAHYLDINRPLGFDNSTDLSASTSYELPSDIATSIADRWALGDVLVTWGVDPDGTPLDGTIDEDTGAIKLTSRPALGAKDLALVSNCQYAHVFEVTGPDPVADSVEHAVNSDDGQANAVDHLRAKDLYAGSALYNRNPGDPRAAIYPLVYKVFYVCCVYKDPETGDPDLVTGGAVDHCRPDDAGYQPEHYRPALCVYDRQFGGGQNDVLIPDVADMRITYNGERGATGQLDFRAEDPSTAAWVTANNGWASVRSAVVELLLASESQSSTSPVSRPASSDWPPNDGVGCDPDTLGADYVDENCEPRDADDRRVYQRFRFEVALRPSTLWMVKQ
jgi:type II secretory pathway pseudopilin PulG